MFYDIKPKYLPYDYITFLVNNKNSIEYFLKVKQGTKSNDTNYYLKTETKENYEHSMSYDNLDNTNILLFLKNDIEYYLKLRNFNENNLNYITSKQELENFFNNINLNSLVVEIFFDRLKTRILDFDTNENGEILKYSTIIKNDYTNITLMSRTEYFVLLPHNISIMTPNDLYLNHLDKESRNPNNLCLKKLPKKFRIPNYTLFTLSCFYNENIDGVKISSIRHLGEIMRGDNNKKQEWINRLNDLKIAIYAYFKNNFDIDDVDKIFIYVRYPEYRTQSLKFYAMYYGDFMAYNDMFFYMSSLIYLDDIVEYIRLSIEKNVDILLVKDYSFFKNKKGNGRINLEESRTWKREQVIEDNQVSNGINLNKSNIWEREQAIENNQVGYKKKFYNSKRGERVLLNGGWQLELNVDISKMDKTQLLEYEWYFVEVKINNNEGYGYDDIIIYGKKDDIHYCLEIKFKKENINNLDNFYNLFANYYVGYFEFELFLKVCNEKKITNYKKIKYDDNFKQFLKIKYKKFYDNNNGIISNLLFNGTVPHDFLSIFNNIIKNQLYFNEGDVNKCLNLLKLTLITKNNISILKYCIEFNKSDIKINNISDENNEICKIVFLLDNNSNYKFELDPAYDKKFDCVQSYNNYFYNLFTKILDKNNVIEYVGWFLYNNIFTFKNNITEVNDNDKIYLEDMHEIITTSFIEYYKKLGFVLLKENIILFYHNPSLISGLHVRILIIKDLNKFLFQREFLYSVKIRYLYSWNVINLLKLNINFLENFMPYVYPYESTYKDMTNTEIISDSTKNIIGGSKNIDNLQKWINKYINIKKIDFIYKIDNMSLEFIIEEKYKEMSNILIYNKFLQYRRYMKDTLGVILRKKIITFFNINIENMLIKILSSLFLNNDNDNCYLYIGHLWRIETDIPNSFYITDNENFNNFNIKYNNKKFNIIYITSSLDVIKNPNTICNFYIKTIISLIWAISHIKSDGCISVGIREISAPINMDLILLLSQFSDLYIFIDYIISDPTGLPIKIIMKNIKNNDILIDYLTEISKFECKQELSFLKIKNNEEKLKIFDNMILKISNNTFKKIFEYMETYEIDKYNTNYPTISKENEEFYLIKSLILFLIRNLYIENSKEEDYYIVFELMQKTKTKRILQIGMDNGNWSVFILTFFKFLYHESDELYKLISVDPNQIKEYKNIGIDNLKNLNLLKYHKLVDDYSFIYMQKLIDKNKFYDIIFINEWVSYDYALTDIFNSLKILNTGGYLIIDGLLNIDIHKITDFIDNNYKTFKKINMGNTNIAIYLKIE
jgi:hypothetical protein